MIESLRYVPIHPAQWREQVRKLLNKFKMPREELIRRIQMTPEQFDEDMREDQPERDKKIWGERLRKYEQLNPQYNREQLASFIRIKIEEFDL